MIKPTATNENNESREVPMTLHRPKPLKSQKIYDRMRDRKDKRLYEEDENETDEEPEGVL